VSWEAAAVVLAVALAADYFVFQLFDINYFRWYLASGPLIQLLFTAFAVAVDLEREPRLISAHPGEYLAACLRVVGMSFIAFAGDLDPKGGRRREGEDPLKGTPLDFLFAALFDFAYLVLCVAWLTVIAPIQYFGNLLAGGPARLALVRPTRTWVSRKPEVTEIETGPIDRAPEGSEEIGLARRPVALTASITAGLLLAIRYSIRYFV
jgi:hypothetical protein